jgi:hypothetical protein
MSDCCLTPNEQYEELDFSKNSSKPYKNNNLDKEDILANHKSFMSSLNIPINEENCCKLNWPKRPSEVLSFSVRRLLSITFHINI